MEKYEKLLREENKQAAVDNIELLNLELEHIREGMKRVAQVGARSLKLNEGKNLDHTSHLSFSLSLSLSRSHYMYTYM